jgi:predicted nucleic acid-binding protein
MEEALQGVDSILLDTAPAIYYLENNPTFGPVMERFFRLRAERRIRLVTTPMTLAECLVHPVLQSRSDLEAAYHDLITTGEGTSFWPIGEEEAVAAARLRAKYKLTLGDSFQIAAALQAKCQSLMTNDAALAKVTEIRILVLSDVI